MRKIHYHEILLYFLEKYKKTDKTPPNAEEFISETKVKIIGTCKYKPYNLQEVDKFRKFILSK